MCSVNGQQQSYTSSNNPNKGGKIDVHLESEYNDNEYVSVKSVFLGSKTFEKSLNSKQYLINPSIVQYQLGGV